MSGLENHLPTEPPTDGAEDTPGLTLHLSRGTRPTRPTVPVLRVVAGPDLLRFLPVVAGKSYVLGREGEADLAFPDPSVSRRHALLRMEPSGRFHIEDLGSTNGTAVNGQSMRSAFVRPGDLIQIGAVTLRLDLLDLAELAHLHRVHEKLVSAESDPLTGLRTRAWLDNDLEIVARRTQEAGRPFALVFVDIDDFKSINDQLGHRVGDEVLASVGRLILLGLRSTDVAVRYGGDEIVLVLPGACEVEAQELAERLRTTLEGHDWSRLGSELRIRASLGVAVLRPGEGVNQCLDRADLALYAAKESGKNSVRSAS